MKITRFEDIEVWKLARELVNDIYKITEKSPFDKDYGLKNQITRASVSIMSIAEGFERKSNKEFVQYLFIAKGSAAEVRSQLYVVFDLKYIDNETFANLSNKAEIISKSISGFIKYLRAN